MSGEDEFQKAKSFLLQSSEKSGANVYDHLTAVITRLLDDRPTNAADILEDVSQQVKAQAFKPASTFRVNVETSQQVKLAGVQTALFKRPEVDPDDDTPPVVPNMLATSQLFEDAGVGLGREETLRVYLALKALADQQPLKSVRFWGKIFGMQRDYIVAECSYKDGEEPQPPEQEPEPEAAADGGSESPEDAVPKSAFVKPKPLATEDYGHGTNKRVYFVCNEPGAEWTLLPNVTPAQVTAARQIKKFLTGTLAAPIVSFPPFPGDEAAYLRAQIARITAATHVSPLGLYTFDEEEEESEEGRESYVVNEEFEGKPRSELLDPTLAGWAHHTQYILPQGRCKWVNPAPKSDEAEEDDEDGEADEAAGPEPETGPPLLSPLQNDADVDGLPAWTPRLTSALTPQFAAVCISSQRWPGAHAVAQGKTFENVYIGWGHKYTAQPYAPPLPPAPQPECSAEAGIGEAADPTRQEEEAWEAEHAAKEDAAQDGGDEGEDED